MPWSIRLKLSGSIMPPPAPGGRPKLRFNHQLFSPFQTNIGTPQGDSLSPVLSIVYLEAALRDLHRSLNISPDFLQQMIVYADDADFICRNIDTVKKIQTEAPAILERWSLKMNSDKTELTTVRRFTTTHRSNRQKDTSWHNTRKLGSLLGIEADISRRMQLASAALRRMWIIWIRRNRVSEETRVRLYNCYVRPILLYNCGTWALTTTQLTRLESFHRRQLRSVIGIRYPLHISNACLYKRCGATPLRTPILKARWELLGHILRRDQTIPANLQMAAFFTKPHSAWPGKPPTTIAHVLNSDLKTLPFPMSLSSSTDLTTLRNLAQDRAIWKLNTRTLLKHMPTG